MNQEQRVGDHYTIVVDVEFRGLVPIPHSGFWANERGLSFFPGDGGQVGPDVIADLPCA